eukprot:626692-Prymnesium_polylepis.1
MLANIVAWCAVGAVRDLPRPGQCGDALLHGEPFAQPRCGVDRHDVALGEMCQVDVVRHVGSGTEKVRGAPWLLQAAVHAHLIRAIPVFAAQQPERATWTRVSIGERERAGDVLAHAARRLGREGVALL